MKCMVIVKSSKDSEKKGFTPSFEILAAMGKYNEELKKPALCWVAVV